MYYAVVALLMFVLPILSVGIEASTSGALTAATIAKWFVIWAVGARLFTAGLRQTLQPRFTQKILGIASEDSLVLIRELGFANIAIGLVGLMSIFKPLWMWPAALCGGIFYLLAGGLHVFAKHRNRLENVAMGSDLFVAVVLLGALARAG
jgi:hypothetical protein